MIEHRMAQGFNIPLHRHDEDETSTSWKDGSASRFGDTLLDLEAGQSLHVPAGTVHAFRAVSETGRFLTVTTGRFEVVSVNEVEIRGGVGAAIGQAA